MYREDANGKPEASFFPQKDAERRWFRMLDKTEKRGYTNCTNINSTVSKVGW